MPLDFTQYGDEWVKEMMQFTKPQLINKLKEAYIKVEKFTSTNSRVIPCLCKEGGIHYKRVVGGIVKEASLSLEINEDCPRHGHYIWL